MMRVGHGCRFISPAPATPFMLGGLGPGRDKLGSITKAGDRYLRSMLMIGALSVIKRVKQLGHTHRPWLAELIARRPVKVAAIALANKIIRMVWAMMVRGETYREPVALSR